MEKERLDEELIIEEEIVQKNELYLIDQSSSQHSHTPPFIPPF